VRFAHECKAKYPLHHYERSGPIMSKLRSVKHPLEIEQLQKACDITDKAFRRVLSFVKPGVTEYEIEAEIIHEFIKNRSTGHAYNPIIASGVDSCVLHYNDNNKACQDGEVLLMDFGAEYANYCADLTRTIPVNGRFTDRQKQVYNACLRVHREACNIMKPGITLAELNEEVAKVVESELIGLGLFSKDDVAKQDANNPLYKKYFMHGNSHFLGLDVHDIGNRYEKLPVGVVLTNEPGIYIPAEKIGIRIENDIWVSDKGNIDLMKNIPIEVEEIESLMNA
jgi:Xaa-Pro aminopeptidase